MATQIDVRDLTNTQWLFDDVVNSLGNAQFAFKLDFTSNGDTFDTIVLNIVGGEIKLYYIHNYTGPDYVYSTSTGWVNDNYKQIEITGGEHATAIGSTIAWLKQNANLIDMQINAPVIVLENNVITWGAVTNAIQYQVYKDEVLFATNTSTQRSINVFKNSGTFYVVAKNENFASANSNEVVYTEKNILMHPQTNGELDKTTNLYPKTLYENIADMIDHITNEVIEGSDKLITSGAVHEAIDLASNTIRYLTVGVDDLSFNNIVSIINDGNFPIIKEDSFYYILVRYETTKLTFAGINYIRTSGLYYSYIRTYEIDNSNNITSKIIFNENKDYKKTNLTDPDDNHYPTTKAVSDGLALKQDTLSFDDTPTQSSTNPVTSDGIYGALADKVDVEEGKGLSENDFTDALKDKLDNIEAQANKTVVDSSLSSTSENPVQNKVIYDALDGKVDKEAEHSLMSDAEHTKLSGVEAGAQVNVLEGVQKNGTDLTITNKKVNIVVDTTFNANSTNLVQSDAIANFVNSSIATNTANFLGTYNIVDDLELTTSATHEAIATAIATKLASLSITVTNNDYVFVAYPDATIPTEYTQFDRYKYNGETTSWGYEFTLNNSSFTAAQWSAINSGINATKVTSYDNHLSNQSNPHGVTKSQVGLGNVDNTSDATKKTNFTGSIASGNTGFATGGDVYTALNGKQDTITDGSATIASENDDIVTLKAGVSQSGGAIGNSSGNDIVLSKVAKTGSYSDLSNKPIYVVDLGTITFNNGSTSTTITETQYNGLNGVDNAFVKFTVDSTVYLCLKDQKQTNRMVFFDERYVVSVENPLNNVSTVYIQDLGDIIHNMMTSQGDLITANQYGLPTRLGKGTNGQVLKSTENGIEWGNESGGSAITPNPSSASTEQLEKATIGSTVYQVQNVELSATDYISDITLNYDDSTSETIEGVLLIENNTIYLEVE